MIMFLCYYKSSLLSQGRDGMINVWNYTSCEWIVMRKFSNENVGFCASEFFSDDNNAFLFALADERCVINVYSYETGNSWHRLEGAKLAGKKIFLLKGYENGFISLWDCESETELCCKKFHNDPVMCLDFESKHFVKGMSGSVDKDLETWTITKDFQLEKLLQVQITNP
ncbi:Guanine nucleotide-binding protein subunit beta-like protein 1, partial [Stegodyphus mimosarum]